MCRFGLGHGAAGGQQLNPQMGSMRGSGLMPVSSPGYMVGEAEFHKPTPPPLSPFAELEQQNSDPSSAQSPPEVASASPQRQKLGNHVSVTQLDSLCTSLQMTS